MTASNKKEKIAIACRKAWEQSGRGKVLLAVSGGPDSTALLLAFSQANIPFEAAHCNFNLRSAESLRDREFARVLCKNYDVKFHLAEFDVPKMALKGESPEMTCRRLRYDFFRKLMKEGGFSRIAVAHHADDNVETFFLNALRGSGSRGLMGMEVDNGEILRPLLKYRRRDLIEFLKANRQNYVTDTTNMRSEDYRRNFLRNIVFPQLESKWEGFTKSITSTMELQRRENAIIEHFIGKALEGYTDFLPWHVIYNFPESETLIFRFIKGFGGTPAIAQEMARSAATLMPGKEWRLTPDTKALFTRKGIKIETTKPDPIEEFTPDYSWTEIEKGKFNMNDILTAPRTEIYLPYGPEKYEWVKANITMKIKPLGLEGSQPVWKVLKDNGYTPAERHNYLVLLDKETQEPIWLPGIKRSRLHLISGDEASVFKVSQSADSSEES